jgi:hypothetical protein
VIEINMQENVITNLSDNAKTKGLSPKAPINHVDQGLTSQDKDRRFLSPKIPITNIYDKTGDGKGPMTSINDKTVL